MSTRSSAPMPDRRRVVIDEPFQVDYWTRALAVAEEDLRLAIAQVGDDVTDVRQALGKETT